MQSNNSPRTIDSRKTPSAERTKTVEDIWKTASCFILVPTSLSVDIVERILWRSRIRDKLLDYMLWYSFVLLKFFPVIILVITILFLQLDNFTVIMNRASRGGCNFVVNPALPFLLNKGDWLAVCTYKYVECSSQSTFDLAMKYLLWVTCCECK